MIYRCIFFCYFFIPQIVFADQTEIYVWAKDGLKLRAETSKNGNVICLLPYGTLVIVKSEHNVDSVLMIPGIKRKNGSYSKPYYIRGNWVFVETTFGAGFVFDGYLSRLKPYKPSSNTDYPTFECWANQQSKVKSKRVMDGKYFEGYESIYENELVYLVDGTSITRLTLQKGYTLNDGILLLNYFQNIHIPYSTLSYMDSNLGHEPHFTLKVSRDEISFGGYSGYCEIECWFSVKLVGNRVVIERGRSC